MQYVVKKTAMYGSSTYGPYSSYQEALEAFQFCSELEGIIPALEPSHALAYTKKIAGDHSSEEIIIMNMCGRGDKDIFTVADALGIDVFS